MDRGSGRKSGCDEIESFPLIRKSPSTLSTMNSIAELLAKKSLWNQPPSEVRIDKMPKSQISVCFRCLSRRWRRAVVERLDAREGRAVDEAQLKAINDAPDAEVRTGEIRALGNDAGSKYAGLRSRTGGAPGSRSEIGFATPKYSCLEKGKRVEIYFLSSSNRDLEAILHLNFDNGQSEEVTSLPLTKGIAKNSQLCFLDGRHHPFDLHSETSTSTSTSFRLHQRPSKKPSSSLPDTKEKKKLLFSLSGLRISPVGRGTQQPPPRGPKGNSAPRNLQGAPRPKQGDARRPASGTCWSLVGQRSPGFGWWKAKQTSILGLGNSSRRENLFP